MSNARMMLRTVVAIGVLLMVVQEGYAVQVDEVVINYSTNRLDGTIAGYAFDAYVDGTGITGGKFVNTATLEEFPLVNRGGGIWGAISMYADLGTFQAHHADLASYHIYLNDLGGGTYEDQVLLGYAVAAPAGFGDILYPPHGGTGIPLDPMYQWDNIEGLGWAYGKQVRNIALTPLFAESPDFDLNETSWQPGALDFGQYYEFLLSVYAITGGAPLEFHTLNDPDHNFTYYGLHTEQNQVNFTTETVPEPVSLMLVGTATLTLAGLRRRRHMK